MHLVEAVRKIIARPMVEKAAQRMGLLDSTLTSEEIRNNPEYFDVVDKLKKRVKTEQEGYTNIIHIKITDYNPLLRNSFVKQ